MDARWVAGALGLACVQWCARTAAQGGSPGSLSRNRTKTRLASSAPGCRACRTCQVPGSVSVRAASPVAPTRVSPLPAPCRRHPEAPRPARSVQLHICVLIGLVSAAAAVLRARPSSGELREQCSGAALCGTRLNPGCTIGGHPNVGMVRCCTRCNQLDWMNGCTVGRCTLVGSQSQAARRTSRGPPGCRQAAGEGVQADEGHQRQTGLENALFLAWCMYCLHFNRDKPAPVHRATRSS